MILILSLTSVLPLIGSVRLSGTDRESQTSSVEKGPYQEYY